MEFPSVFDYTKGKGTFQHGLITDYGKASDGLAALKNAIGAAVATAAPMLYAVTDRCTVYFTAATTA
jgi:hypothetical protein